MPPIASQPIIDTPTPGTGALPGALPRTGVVLIGTPATVRQADAMLRLLDKAPIVAGCVLVPGSRTSGAPLDDLGVVVLGTLNDLPILAARLGLKVAVICLPPGAGLGAEAAPGEVSPSVVRGAAERAGLGVRMLPTVAELLSGAGERESGTEAPGQGGTPATPKQGAAWTASPTVDLAALINRVPHDLDRAAVAEVLKGKRVLITGAGGSIGSELARVAASFEPSQLILMERGENALFEIDRQLSQRFPGLKRKAVLHDVVDAEATANLLAELRPHTVFHAAAHKHVPLMEDHPAHAVTNNLFGTKAIADASVLCGAERFVMISSDKAVNPTSVMGATKRMAEMYIQALGSRTASQGGAQINRQSTRLSMVRFGNVLGSNASVLTIWSQQIGEGGPITVTDPRMTRYFMTIPEAATLVIQSTTLVPEGGGGVGVYVLDMGEPIAIAELAMRFARAHGLAPRVRTDGSSLPAQELAHKLSGLLAGSVSGPGIDVVFTGARPGEKLHEELAYAAESLKPTAHPGIRAWAGSGFEDEVAARADRMVAEMAAARFSADRYQVLSMIRKHVPEMRPPSPAAAQTPHPNVG